MLEMGDFLVDVVKELEKLSVAAAAELALVRANVDSLKQETSLRAS